MNTDVESSKKAIENNWVVREFFRDDNLHPLFLTLVLHFLQNWSGVNVIVFKTVNVFETVGSNIDKYVCTLIVGVVQLLSAGGILLRITFHIILSLPSIPEPGGQGWKKTSPHDLWPGDDSVHGIPGSVPVF